MTKTYTTAEAQEILKVSKRTLYRYIDSGQLQAVKIGRDYRITEEALEDFLHPGTNNQNPTSENYH